MTPERLSELIDRAAEDSSHEGDHLRELIDALQAEQHKCVNLMNALVHKMAPAYRLSEAAVSEIGDGAVVGTVPSLMSVIELCCDLAMAKNAASAQEAIADAMQTRLAAYDAATDRALADDGKIKVCTHCRAPAGTDEEIRSHILACEANPVVKRCQELEVRVAEGVGLAERGVAIVDAYEARIEVLKDGIEGVRSVIKGEFPAGLRSHLAKIILRDHQSAEAMPR
jgi:hypothetical protein